MDTDKLKALALGYVYENGDHWYNEHQVSDGISYEPAANFIVGCSPATVLALIAEVEDADRLLRASVPDRWKDCASPVGAVQSYIAELEAEVERLRAARGKREIPPEMKAAIDEAHKTGMTAALLPNGSAVFINNGDQPEDTSHLCCTACGGSGHIDDQKDIARRAAPAAGTEKDTARLDFMITEECQIEHIDRVGAGPVYRVRWPWTYAQQSEWSATPRDAIDKAIAAKEPPCGS